MKITKRELLEEILINQKIIMDALKNNTNWDDDSLDGLRIRISETVEAIRLSRE